MNTQNRTKRLPFALSVMGISAVISKLLGLFRDILIADIWGTSTEAAAYSAASRIPSLFFDMLIGGVVTSVMIPMFGKIRASKGIEKACLFSSSYINLIIAVGIVLSIIGMIFADGLVRIITPNISNDSRVLAVRLTRIMFPMVILSGIAYSFVGILQAMGELAVPPLISVLSNAAVILYLLTLSDIFGITGLAASVLIGWGLQAAVQLPKLRNLGWRYTPILGDESGYIKNAVKTSFPILAISWTSPITTLLGTRFASEIFGELGVTSLEYAARLYTALSGIFIFVCSNLIFPKLAKAASTGDRITEAEITTKGIKASVFITAPISAGAIVLAPEITAAIYERGMFTSNDTAVTAAALSGYAFGALFLCVNEITQKALIAGNNAKKPMISAVLGAILSFVLLPILSDSCGMFGISLSSSAGMALSSTLNLLMFRKSHSKIFCKDDIICMARYIFSAAIMGLTVHLISSIFASPIVTIAVSVVIGATVYFLLLYTTRKV